MLKVGSRGIDKFDGRVPPIWVTAPTRESESVGFLVNAGFEVDAGRSRLASHSKHNTELAKRLGRELGGAFADVYRAGQLDWNAVRQQLDLASDVSQAEYWASLWRALQQRRDATEAEVYRLANVIVSEALGKLTKATGFVPNGISGDLAGFVATKLPLGVCRTIGFSWPGRSVSKNFCGLSLSHVTRCRVDPERGCSALFLFDFAVSCNGLILLVMSGSHQHMHTFQVERHRHQLPFA